MSVAFRREGDDEHLEPKFELPIPPGPNIVTPRGLSLIEAKVAEWSAIVAAATDDEARKKARRDLAYWSTRLATARVADPPANGVAGIGARVTYRFRGDVRTIDIVGHDEADPASALIAFSAPLARAMVGGRAEELVDFGGVTEAIEILSVDDAAS